MAKAKQFAILDLKRRDVPACFSSQSQFKTWRHSGNIEGFAKNGYCIDCLPSYQQRMAGLDRCAYPDTFFALDADGFIEGRRIVDGSISNDPKRMMAVGPCRIFMSAQELQSIGL